MDIDFVGTTIVWASLVWVWLWPVIVASTYGVLRRHRINKLLIFVLAGSVLSYLVGVIIGLLSYQVFYKIMAEVISGKSPNVLVALSIAEVIVCVICASLSLLWLERKWPYRKLLVAS